MRKYLKIIVSIFLFCIAVSTFSSSVFAQENEEIDITVTKDKEHYEYEDISNVTVSVTNTLKDDINDVLVKIETPNGLTLEQGKVETYLDTIKSKETKNTQLLFKQLNPSQNEEDTDSDKKSDTAETAAENKVFLWISISLISGSCIVIIIICKKRRGNIRKIGVFLLIAVTGLSSIGISNNNVYANDTEQLKRVETRKVSIDYPNQSYAIKVSVSYTIHKDEVATEEISREEWIYSLLDILNVDTDNQIKEFSFSDYEKVEKPKRIETAYRLGIIPETFDNQGNLIFSADDPATREFIAYTSVHGMKYEIPDSIPNWQDLQNCEYPKEDNLAVQLDLLSLKENCFLPSNSITEEEKEKILSSIKELMSADTDGNHKVQYVDGVQETEFSYQLDEDNHTITTERIDIVGNWNVGEIHALIHDENPESSRAIRIENINISNNQATIVYSVPDLQEVVASMDMNGTETQNGYFVPDEGVTILNRPTSRSSLSGSISLFEPIEFSKTVKIDGKNVELLKGTIAIDSVDYNFKLKLDWFNTSVDRVYLALNSSAKFTSDLDLSDFVDKDNLEYKVSLGKFNVFLGYGFFLEGNLNAIFNIDGSFKLDYEFSNVTGIDYNKGKLKTIFDIDSELNELTLQGEMKAGFAFEPEVTFLGLNLATVGAELGRSFEGELDVIEISPFQFCLDGATYIYANVSGGILNNWLSFKDTILDKENGLGMMHMHFEENGFVDECTRSKGDYKGRIVDENTLEPIPNAKISILQEKTEIDHCLSDESGAFSGQKIDKGKYSLIVTSEGYETFKDTIEIEGNKTIDLGDIKLNKEQPKEIIKGMVYDETTKQPISGAQIVVVDSDINTESSSSGQYEIECPQGVQEIEVSKEGYISKIIKVNTEESLNYDVYLESDVQGTTINIHAGETVRIKQLNADADSKLNYRIEVTQDTIYDIAKYGGGSYALGLDKYYSGSALENQQIIAGSSPAQDYLYLFNDITVKSGELSIYFVDSEGNKIDYSNLVEVQPLSESAILEYHIYPGETLTVDGSILDDVIYDGSLYSVSTLPGTKGEILTIWNNPELEPLKEEIQHPWAASVESGIETVNYTCLEGEIVVYIARDDVNRIINVTKK